MDPFYARFFPGEHSDAEAGYHRELQCRLIGARSVLDFGCGDNTELARYRTPEREVWGVDFQAHPQLHRSDWFQLLPPSGQVPFPDQSFDVIGSCWVLEHVKETDRFLSEVQRLLRPGGFFVCLTINSLHYVTLISRLVGLLPHWVTQRLVRKLYGRALHDTFPTYYRLNHSARLRRAAQRNGLEVTGITRFENPDYFSFSARLRRWAIVVDYLLGQCHPEFGRLYLVATLHRPVAHVEAGPARAWTLCRRPAA